MGEIKEPTSRVSPWRRRKVPKEKKSLQESGSGATRVRDETITSIIRRLKENRATKKGQEFQWQQSKSGPRKEVRISEKKGDEHRKREDDNQ